MLFQYHAWGDGSRLSNIVTSMADANGNTVRWQRNYAFGGADPLDWILEYGINDYTGQWQSGLPATNFYYANYIHNNQPINGGNRLLLSKITNGYGGEWSYDYAGDPVLNSYWVTNAWTKSLIGGVVKWTGRKVYDYSPNKCIANSASAGQCVNAAHVFNDNWPNNVVGFEWVNEKTVDPANTNTVYAWSKHYFKYNDLHKLGREWKTQSLNGSGGVLQAQQTDFYDWSGGTHGPPSGAWFVAPQYVTSYPFGDVGSSPYQRSYTDYDDNGTLVGANVTRQVNHGFVCGNPACTGDEVTTRLGYYPNTGGAVWIVSKLAFANTYEGADETTFWPNLPFKTQSLLTYDYQADYDYTPIKGQLTKVGSGHSGIGAEWTTQQVSYDSTGNISALTDGRNNTTNAAYDPNGWFLTQVQTPPNGAGTRLSTQYRYYGVDESGCAGGTGTYGLLKCSIDPNGIASASYSYDVFGRLRKIAKPGDTFARPTEEYFYYDTNSPFFSQRFVRRQGFTGVNPSDMSFTNPHSNGGWWQSNWAIDLNALAVWERAYTDGLGRPIETQTPMADWVDTGGQIAIGWTSYDNAGRAWQQSMPYSEAYSGGLYREPNTSVAKTSTAYDALGRVTSVTGPDGAVTQHGYQIDTTASGYVATNTALHYVIDAVGHMKHQVTDGLGRMTRVRELTGTGPWPFYAETKYAYDYAGNLTDVWDAATPSNNTHINYDALGRKKNMTDPDMGYWQYGYDQNGNLTSQIDARGINLTFVYDALNRMTAKFQGGTALTWSLYDAWWDGTPKPNLKGRRTITVAYLNGAWNNSKTWEYDSRGRLNKETTYTDVEYFDTQYDYDSADRPTWLMYPNGEWVYSHYNPAGQPKSLQPYNSGIGWGTHYVLDATYNALGQVKQINLGNTLSVRQKYFGIDFGVDTPPAWGNWLFGRLRQICVIATSASDCTTANGGTSSPAARFNKFYAWDNVGNVTETGEMVLGESEGFTYDHLDRLKNFCINQATCSDSNSTEHYDYNAIGNITSKTGAGTYSYASWGTCGDGVKPHAVRTVSNAGTLTFGSCYDANGNSTWRLDSGKLYWQTWNADNKLSSVQEKSLVDWATNIEIATQLFYDGGGNLVKRMNANGATFYIGNFFEKNTTTGEYTHYYYFGGQRVAMRKSTNPSPGTGTVTYIHGDHLGSANVTTDASGTKTSDRRYKPFGETRFSWGLLPTDKTFTGQRVEPGLGGIMDYGARYYSPVIGRFLSADTIVPGVGNPQALNRYSYTLNNPLGYIDVSGHIPYPITVRSFAPFVEFGGGYNGDNRGYSTSSSVTSKVEQQIDFDTDRTGLTVSASQTGETYKVDNPQDRQRRNPSWKITHPR